MSNQLETEPTVNAPTLSIGLPVYNGEEYLREAIESILTQDFDDLELLIGDNGSTDGTEAICREYVAKDARVKYFRSEVNRGAFWNYNRLFPLGRGRYWKWQAHDDVLGPGFLSRCIETLEQASSDVVLVFPKTVIIDENSAVVDAEYICDLDFQEERAARRLQDYVVHDGEQHAVFGVYRTEAVRKTGLTGNYWGGDIGFLAELLCQGKFVELPDRLFLRRYHSGTSLVSNKDPGEVAAWFDPRKKGKNAWPRTRLLWEISKGINRSPQSVVGKAKCEASVLRAWVPHFGRVMVGEAKRGVKYRLGWLKHKLKH